MMAREPDRNASHPEGESPYSVSGPGILTPIVVVVVLAVVLGGANRLARFLDAPKLKLAQRALQDLPRMFKVGKYYFIGPALDAQTELDIIAWGGK